MNAPRTYINLRVNPKNEAEVLGQYVGTDGEVSEQLYLVATMSGNPTGRRHAAKLLAASEGLRDALIEAAAFIKATGDCATDAEMSDFLCNNCDTVEETIETALSKLID